MSKGTCASCLDFDVDKVVKSKESLKPTWLQKNDYVQKFIASQPLKLRLPPSNANVEMKLKMTPEFAGRKVLYWASTQKKDKSPIIEDAKKAYHNFENSGITQVSSSGIITFKFACPQLYKAKRTNASNDTTFFRHMHFVVEKKGSWYPQIYTKVVICKYELRKFVEEKNNELTVLINALPCEYYAKDHVPNSYNLFNKDVKKMSINDLLKWFGEVIEIHYPKLHTYVKNKKIDIYEVPIVVYCAHDKCNAAELTIKELMKKGFVNIHEFSGGMKEYREKYSQDK